MTQPPPSVPIRPYAPAAGYSVPAQAASPPWYPYGYRPPVPVAPSGAPLAEFGDRLVAYLLDSLIVGVVLLIPYVIGAVTFFRRFFEQMDLADQTGTAPSVSGIFVPYLIFLGYTLALQLVAQFGYQVLYQSRTGQTVGKRVMKIRVECLDGEPLSVATALRRWLMQGPAAMVVPFLTWLDGLWQLWDKPYRQCLHDKVAKTVVVRANTGPRAVVS
ncbi:MAG: RDD family protein [Micromonosporaceae bacterium]|nr:RDD family protein [Micromonosporaceae bacterium]